MISRLMDRLSEFFSQRKGLLPLIGILLVALNLVLQFVLPTNNVLAHSNLFLHVGVIIGLFGILLAWAL